MTNRREGIPVLRNVRFEEANGVAET